MSCRSKKKSAASRSRSSIPRPAVRAKGESGANEGWAPAGVCLFLAAIVWVVFGQTAGFGFVNYDDNSYIYENPRIISGLNWQSIPWAFTHIHSGNWHPLTTLSHMFDCQLYGLQPCGPHVENVLLHCTAAILLFLAINRMTGMLWRSAFVAAVFAIHPLRVESVAWVSERKDVLSGVFFMLTILAYARYVRTGRSKMAYLAVMILFAFGLLSKPTLVTLPFVLLLMDWWPLGRLEAGEGFWNRAVQLVLEKAPLLMLSLASCVATVWAQKGALVQIERIPLPDRIGNALVSYVVYVIQMFWPVDLAVFYPHPGKALPMWEAGAALVLLAAVTGVVCALWRTRPWLTAGWFWYLGILVPVIGIVQVGMQAHSDRYTYLSQIGLYVMLTWTGAELRMPQWAAAMLSGGMILILAIIAFVQTTYWHDSESLWTHALASTENNYIAHNNLGNTLMRRGDFGGALAQYQSALEIDPNFAEAHNNAGNILLRQGDVDDAINQYEASLKSDPGYAEAHYNLGNAFSKKGALDKAVAQYQEAVAGNPDSAESLYSLGLMFRKMGRIGEAIDEYKKALQIRPDYTEAENNLAYLLAVCPDPQLRDGAAAEQLAQRANQRTGGKNPMVLGTLAAAYAEEGRFPEAVETVSQAIEVAEAQGNLAMVNTLQSLMKLYQAGKPLREN